MATMQLLSSSGTIDALRRHAAHPSAYAGRINRGGMALAVSAGALAYSAPSFTSAPAARSVTYRATAASTDTAPVASPSAPVGSSRAAAVGVAAAAAGAATIAAGKKSRRRKPRSVTVRSRGGEEVTRASFPLEALHNDAVEKVREAALAGQQRVDPRLARAPHFDTQRVHVALCQLQVGLDKERNITGAEAAIHDACDNGADLICLPESWNAPYGNQYFAEYAEAVPANAANLDASQSPSLSMLMNVARKRQVYICGGSMPEREGNTLYNTGVVIGPDGSIVCKYRKLHLFDIDIPGEMTFKESDTLCAGDEVAVFNSPWGRIGVAICYDMRFPEVSMLMRRDGAKMILFPGAFNTTTGPLHYELLARARAVDNQCFVCAISPARTPGFDYQAWGHSSVIDPWGKVVATCGHESSLIHTTLDMAEVESFRRKVPISRQKRNDIYQLDKVIRPSTPRLHG